LMILNKVAGQDYLVLLDENGKSLSRENLQILFKKT
jgi:hypothetical protein